MKILQVNQYYYPRGGADKYFLDLSRTLIDLGHEVAVFSMKHPKNEDSRWSKYFISRVSFNKQSLKDMIKTPGRVLYSLEAKRKFKKLLEDFKPDIIHCHNIYNHISPSILDVAYAKKIPVIMHLHDYKLVCPNHMLFVKGRYCEECRPNKYYNCVKNKCIKNSLAGSVLACLEMYLHHNILKIYEKKVKLFIAPSEFMKNTVINFGQAENRVKVVYNPHNLMKQNPDFNDKDKTIPNNYILYFGRLSEEKGLINLIEASSQTKQTVLIAGSGPEEENLKKLTEKLKAPVKFIGFKSSSELINIIKSSQGVVIPSIWAENMPLSLMESLSLSKIVIASRIGGLPEIIKDKENGLLFEPGNSEDLAAKINYFNNLSLNNKMILEKNAEQTSKLFSVEKNLNSIIDIYKNIITKI